MIKSKKGLFIVLAAAIAIALAAVSVTLGNGHDGYHKLYCDNDSDNHYSIIQSSFCYGYDCNEETGCIEVPGDDCNDFNADIYPGATEVCNGIDDNCNNLIDEYLVCKEEKEEDDKIYPTRNIYVSSLMMNYEESPVISPGSQLYVDTNIDNIGEVDFDKTTVRITILELGLSRTIGPFDDLQEDSFAHKRVIFDIPSDAQPGTYTIRMSIYSDGGLKRTVHREFFIQ